MPPAQTQDQDRGSANRSSIPVLFGTKDEIGEKDGHRGRRQGHNACCQRQESKRIVCAGGKETRKYEVQLNECSA